MFEDDTREVSDEVGRYFPRMTDKGRRYMGGSSSLNMGSYPRETPPDEKKRKAEAQRKRYWREKCRLGLAGQGTKAGT